MDDPYAYPGTNVLINRKGLQDREALAHFERLMSAERFDQLLQRPSAFALSYAGYRSIHRSLFGDVYEWAGQSRMVGLSKGETYFGPPQFVDQAMEKRFALLGRENDLKGLSAEQFAGRAAEHLCEINAIHPFREGNGRTQRAFLVVLGEQAGHPVDLARVVPGQWLDASIRGMDGDYAPMREVIARMLPGAVPVIADHQISDFERWSGIGPARSDMEQAPGRTPIQELDLEQ